MTSFGAVFGTVFALIMVAAVGAAGMMWNDRRWAWPLMVWEVATAVVAGGISYVFFTQL